MPDKTKTIDDYLASLPEDRQLAIRAVRKVLLKNLDSGYEEGIGYGMIGYWVPRSLYPAGYHCDPKQPLGFAALGSQKNYMVLHLMCLYSGGDSESPAARLQEWFRSEWEKTGKKLDMGKACIRFKSIDDLALDVIGKTVGRVSVRQWIETNEKFLAQRQSRRKTTKQ